MAQKLKIREFQNEVLIIANEEWDRVENTFSVASYTSASELTIPNSPASSVDSIISDFVIPYSKFPSTILTKLNNEVPILPSDVNIIVRNVVDELIHHKMLPSRSNYRAIARELC